MFERIPLSKWARFTRRCMRKTPFSVRDVQKTEIMFGFGF